MPLSLVTHIELPAHKSSGESEHADIYAPTDRLYVAHTSNDAIDVIDCARDRYIASIPDLTAVAGALVSEACNLVFTSNRGENTISIFTPGAENQAYKIGVGIRRNGLLITANVGDASVPNSYSITTVDIGDRKQIADIKVSGRTRWAVYDATLEMFFVNIASPPQIIAIDPREPTSQGLRP